MEDIDLEMIDGEELYLILIHGLIKSTKEGMDMDEFTQFYVGLKTLFDKSKKLGLFLDENTIFQEQEKISIYESHNALGFLLCENVEEKYIICAYKLNKEMMVENDIINILSHISKAKMRHYELFTLLIDDLNSIDEIPSYAQLEENLISNGRYCELKYLVLSGYVLKNQKLNDELFDNIETLQNYRKKKADI